MTNQELLSRCFEFLDEIGIPWKQESISESTFLPGIKIENGGLIIDLEKLDYPGDVLHEAGHIALLPASDRPFVDQKMLDSIPPAQSMEIGVILWTILAARHLGIPEEMIFHAGGYKGQSDWWLQMTQQKTYVGMPLLQWAGIARLNHNGEPEVLNWLRNNAA
jgi:hypothetical protein